jgi:nuclear pore complex protein Nup205
MFNDDFKQETLFLSQELDISELFCAELLDHTMARDPNLGKSATAEKAVIIYHEERAELLACLRKILEDAMNSDSMPSRLSQMLQKFAVEIIASEIDIGSVKGRLVGKILAEIDNLKGTITKQRVALQSATSNPSFPFGVASTCMSIF